MNLESEILLQTSRSGGKGGQHVNKVETQVEARFHIGGSKLFSNEQKELLQTRLAHRLSKDGTLIIRSSSARSQLENKHLAIKKLYDVIAHSLKPIKKRIATKASKAQKQKRMLDKKYRANVKVLRKKPSF